MELQQTFGMVVRALREERDLTQQQLAENANLERNYISLIELGKSCPSICVLFKLCKGLGVSTPFLMARVEEFIQSLDNIQNTEKGVPPTGCQ